MKKLIKAKVTRTFIFGAAAFLATGLTACQGGPVGMDTQDGASANLPWVDAAASNDPNHLTVAMKYVSYVGPDGQPVVAKDTAKAVIEGVNQLYASCNVHFRVEQFAVVNPVDSGLKFNPSNMGELNPIRNAFDDDAYIVVINTGQWNSAGGLGADGANAWTMMPGSKPSGAVLESSVAATTTLVAHEIGHYMNLDHMSNTANMMNPVIYSTSTELTHSQCEKVRQAALTARKGALRAKS